MKPDISVIAPFALTLALAIGAFSPETAAEEHAMPAPVVFFDIAAPQLEKQAAFYKAVFGWDVAADGGFAVPVSAGLGNLGLSAFHLDQPHAIARRVREQPHDGHARNLQTREDHRASVGCHAGQSRIDIRHSDVDQPLRHRSLVRGLDPQIAPKRR